MGNIPVDLKNVDHVAFDRKGNLLAVVVDDGSSRRAKRSKSYDSFIDSASAYEIMDELRNSGYGNWEAMSEKFQGHSASQIERFSLALILLCFRAIPAMQIATFPFLLKKLEKDVYDFKLDMLICTKKGKWIQAVNDQNDLYMEVNACKPLKDTIYDIAFEFLSVIEMKLIAKTWLTFNNMASFNFNRIPPKYTKKDPQYLEELCAERSDFDPYDERIQAIVNTMRSDIIAGGRIFAAKQLEFWTATEFAAVTYMMKNFTFSLDNPLQLHMKTGLISKTTEQVVVFVTHLQGLVMKRLKKFPVVLKSNITMFDRAPEDLISSKGAQSWTQIQKKDYNDLVERMSVLRILQTCAERIADFPETTTWSNYHSKKLFKYIIEFGLESMRSILLDKKIGLVRILNKVDRRFVQGKLKSRIKEQNAPPDFALSEEALIHFLSTEDAEDYFERMKYQQYTYVPEGQQVEADLSDSTSDDSDALNQLPDDEPVLGPTTHSGMGQSNFFGDILLNQPRKSKRHDDDSFDETLLDDDD